MSQACIQRECQDPCPYEQCGIKAICTVNVHRARCQCPPGHKGSPYVECRPYECLTDPECPTTLACRNEKCVDPCACAANAVCEAQNHRGICTCIPDYRGDPYFAGCEPSKSKIASLVKRILSKICFVCQSQNLWLKSKTAEWMLIALLFRFVTSQAAGTDV